MDRKPTILRLIEILAQITASVVGTHHNSTFQKFSAMLKLKARRSQTGDTGLHKFKRYVKVTMYKLFDLLWCAIEMECLLYKHYVNGAALSQHYIP